MPHGGQLEKFVDFFGPRSLQRDRDAEVVPEIVVTELHVFGLEIEALNNVLSGLGRRSGCQTKHRKLLFFLLRDSF